MIFYQILSRKRQFGERILKVVVEHCPDLVALAHELRKHGFVWRTKHSSTPFLAF